MLTNLSELRFFINVVLNMYKGFHLKGWYFGTKNSKGDFGNESHGGEDSMNKMFEWLERLPSDALDSYYTNDTGESLLDKRTNYYGWVLFQNSDGEYVWLERTGGYDNDSSWSLKKIPNYFYGIKNYCKIRDNEMERKYIESEFEKERRKGDKTEICILARTLEDEKFLRHMAKNNICIDNWCVHGTETRVTPSVNENEDLFDLTVLDKRSGIKMMFRKKKLSEISDIASKVMESVTLMKECQKGPLNFIDMTCTVKADEYTGPLTQVQPIDA